MIIVTDIKILLKSWIELYTGLSSDNVISSWGNGPKPTPPYISFQLGTITPIGHECRSNPYENAGEMNVKISGNRDMIVNLQAYGNNAYGILENLYHYIHVEASINMLATEGLALIDMVSLAQLTGLNDLEFEERASMDLLFRFATQLNDINVGFIDTVNVTGQLKEPDKTINIGIDLTI